MIDMHDEIWRPVPIEGYEELYEISNTGKIRSAARVVNRTRLWHGNKLDTHIAHYKSKELKPCRTYSDIGNKYHLHKRTQRGAQGQTDIYVYAYQLVDIAFPELRSPYMNHNND